jgi:hypothetical protein
LKTTQWLPVKLTDDEVAERADALARTLRELATADMNHKLAASKHRKQVKTLRDEIAELGREVESRKTERDVEVDDVPDYDCGVMERIRLDTGELVASRVMTPEERQQGLRFAAAPTEIDH